MPPVLDRSAFPHIFDLVVSHAPWPALLALRTTSREIRDLIDMDVLGRYLEIRDEGGLQWVLPVMGTNGHRHPAFAVWSKEWNPEEDEDDDGMDTHFGPPMKFPAQDPTHSIVVARAARALTLEPCPPFFAFKEFASLLKPFSRPLRVRCNGIMLQDYILQFIHTANLIVFKERLELGFFGVSHSPRIVVNFALEPSDTRLPRWWPEAEPPVHTHRTELVLIYSWKHGATPGIEWDTTMEQLITHVLLPLAVDEELSGVTVVGLADLPPQVSGIDGSSVAERNETLLHKIGESVAGTGNPITVFTMEEYRNTIPGEQFALETIQDIRDIPRRFS